MRSTGAAWVATAMASWLAWWPAVSRAETWAADVDIGYSESRAMDNDAPAAHLAVLQLRALRLVAARTRLSLTVTLPVVPLAPGQFGAALGLHRDWLVRSDHLSAEGNGRTLETLLTAGAVGGYAVTTRGSGFDEESPMTKFRGPYSRADLGFLWMLEPDPARGRLGAGAGIVIGSGITRAHYSSPQASAGWRWSLDVSLVSQLRW